jgi:hypothetical protein
MADDGRDELNTLCENAFRRAGLDGNLPTEGTLRNLASAAEDVGRSSKASNSFPSPYTRRRTGLVTWRLLAAALANASGAWSRRTGDCWR